MPATGVVSTAHVANGKTDCYLLLEDGNVFTGKRFGATDMPVDGEIGELLTRARTSDTCSDDSWLTSLRFSIGLLVLALEPVACSAG